MTREILEEVLDIKLRPLHQKLELTLEGMKRNGLVSQQEINHIVRNETPPSWHRTK